MLSANVKIKFCLPLSAEPKICCLAGIHVREREREREREKKRERERNLYDSRVSGHQLLFPPCPPPPPSLHRPALPTLAIIILLSVFLNLCLF